MKRLGVRVASVATALALHAAVAVALISGTPRERPLDPSVEIEVVAQATSEILPAELEEISAASEAAEEANETREGASATVISDETPLLDLVDPDAAKAIDVVPEDAASKTDAETAKAAELPAEQDPVEMAACADPPEPPKEQQTAALPIIVEPPDIAAAEAPQIAEAERLSPQEAPVMTVGETPPEEVAVSEPRKRDPPPRRSAKPKKPPKPMVAGARERKPATRAGDSLARKSGGSRAASSYRSVVMARINRRKSSIAARLPGGVTGTVLISFSIGPSGAVSRAAVSRSSGSGAIDSAARSTIGSITFPPPPGGRFTATVPIRVN